MIKENYKDTLSYKVYNVTISYNTKWYAQINRTKSKDIVSSSAKYT